jgi:purine-binding chemotaxis protein CheW
MGALAEKEIIDVDTHDANGAMQYLTFMLADETYAIDILRVQEIRGWESVTRVPNTVSYVKGVLNLRGAIVPVIDLRERFSLPRGEYSVLSVVIVVSVFDGDRARIMGMLVDAVNDVIGLRQEDFRQTPVLGSKVDTKFIQGLTPVDNVMVMVLDIDSMLHVSDMVVESRFTE